MTAPTIEPPGSFLQPDLVCVGGVPGAGKSTAIREVGRDLAHVVALDPEEIHRLLAGRLPAALPYGSYRWAVHTLHTVRVAYHVLRGPAPHRVLVVHEPCTRSRRRRVFVRGARLFGWRPALLYVGADRSVARSGQLQRGRLVPAPSFDRHWLRWLALRRELVADPAAFDGHRWGLVVMVERAEAAAALHALCEPRMVSNGGRSTSPSPPKAVE